MKPTQPRIGAFCGKESDELIRCRLCGFYYCEKHARSVTTIVLKGVSE